MKSRSGLISEQTEKAGSGVKIKAQGEDKPAMGIHLIDEVYAGLSKSYGGSNKKGPTIKGGIGGEL